VAGVLDKHELMTDLTPADIAGLRADGTVSGGMIPKLETCVAAVEAGSMRPSCSTGGCRTGCCWKSSRGAARGR